MRIGLVLPLEREASNGSPPWAIAVAERAEAIGLDSVWAYDHFFFEHAGRAAANAGP